MAKRFSPDEDRFIVEYLEVVGSNHLALDIRRSAAAITRRANTLRETGAWEAYKAEKKASIHALILAGHMTREDAEVFHGPEFVA